MTGFAYAVLGLVFCSCFCHGCLGQSTSVQSTEVSAVPSQPARIVDLEAARRAKLRERAFHSELVPLWPFILLGHGMEKGLVAIDRHHLLDRVRHILAEHDRGVRPLFGGLGVGTGFALGAEYYHNGVLRPGGRFNAQARASWLRYQDFGLTVTLPFDSGRRIFFDSSAHYAVRTQDDFFGLGGDSRVSDRTTYMLHSREFLFGPRLQLGKQLSAVVQAGYRVTDVFNGEDQRFPVIRSRFTGDQVPGLGNGAREWVATARMSFDTRDVPGRPRTGGYYRLVAGWHQGADRNDFGFWRYEAEAERYIKLWSRNRILALRFVGITNQPRGGSSVPFFEQAILGGSSTMRGFREFRFYDLSGVVMTAEYRYNLNAFTDLVMFVDQGQVARQPGDFSWRGLRTGYGGGLRFLSAQSTPFKIIFGRSNEGNRLYFSLGAAF